MNLGHFSGFKVNGYVQFELLQLTNDMVVICDGKWENLWSLKSILRGFQLVSQLCHNLNKSMVFVIYIKADFL